MRIAALTLGGCASACAGIRQPADTSPLRMVALDGTALVAGAPELISVFAVCPGRFVVRNRDTADAVVRFGMRPSSLNREVVVPARAPLLGWSETFVTFAKAGRMGASVNGREIASQAYGLTPCPVLPQSPDEVPRMRDSMVWINAGLISGPRTTEQSPVQGPHLG
jgi:hypothetical protein